MAKKKAVKKKIIKKKAVRKKAVKKTNTSRSKSASKAKIKKKAIVIKKWHAVPLKGSFMITSILGFFISLYWVYPKSFNFGIAFMFIFTAMFIAAMISMTKAPLME